MTVTSRFLLPTALVLAVMVAVLALSGGRPVPADRAAFEWAGAANCRYILTPDQAARRSDCVRLFVGQ